MSAIKNYGLLWKREHIFLGSQGVAGNLLGWRRKQREANFKEQAGVYILYDKDMIPVYVGQAGRGTKALHSRLKDHFNDHLWNRWEHFSWFGLYKVDENDSLLISEKSLVFTISEKY